MVARAHFRAAVLAATALMLSGCLPALDASWAHTVTTQFQGKHQLALNSYYNDPTQTITLDGYADVANGTVGEVEITGPRHLLCPGAFKAHAPVDFFTFFPSDQESRWRRIANLPQFTPEGGGPRDITGPKGSYTITIRLPGASAHVSTTVTAPAMYAGSFNLYSKPHSCYPIADSLPQQRSLLDTYLAALVKLTAQTPPSLQPEFSGTIADLQSALTKANAASDPTDVAQAYANATQALNRLQDQLSVHGTALAPTISFQMAEAVGDALHLVPKR